MNTTTNAARATVLGGSTARYRLTQGQVARLARLYGLRRTSHDGPDPTRGGLGEEDISHGEWAAVLGDPASSLHEVVHGHLGLCGREVWATLRESGNPEGLLVEPLEWALTDWLSGAADPLARLGVAERLQLRAAGLWGADGPIFGASVGEDECAAALAIDNRWRAASHPHRAEAALPAWW